MKYFLMISILKQKYFLDLFARPEDSGDVERVTVLNRLMQWNTTVSLLPRLRPTLTPHTSLGPSEPPRSPHGRADSTINKAMKVSASAPILPPWWSFSNCTKTVKAAADIKECSLWWNLILQNHLLLLL